VGGGLGIILLVSRTQGYKRRPELAEEALGGSEGNGEKEFFETLDHEVRRSILLNIYDKVEMSYTDILHSLKISEGALNFHLKKLAEFIQRTGKGTSGCGRKVTPSSLLSQ